jgi:TM2 domain-containing membrane protein YozV
VDTKPCPKCGEEIKAVATRCRFCQADLSAGEPAPDFDRGVSPEASRQGVTAEGAAAKAAAGGSDFEQRFLEYAHHTSEPINAASVAYATKVGIAEASEKLEDLAARDLIIREVDDEGQVNYRLPGRPKPGAMVPAGPRALTKPPVDESTALVGLLVNLPLPGVGSLIAGRTREGILQLVTVSIALPLCLVLIGFPMLIGAWVWALVTSIKAVNEAKAQNQ